MRKVAEVHFGAARLNTVGRDGSPPLKGARVFAQAKIRVVPRSFRLRPFFRDGVFFICNPRLNFCHDPQRLFFRHKRQKYSLIHKVLPAFFDTSGKKLSR